MLSGKKTYLVSAALVVYAGAGLFLGYLTPETALSLLLNGLGLGALRNAIGGK